MARGPLLSAADVAHCPHRVALDRDPLAESVPWAPSTEIQRRIREASHHRTLVSDRLRVLHPAAVLAGNEEATRDAMRRGEALILQPRLTETAPGRRSAAVDLLVRTDDFGPPYRSRPVLVKNNEVIETATTRRLLEGSLTSLTPEGSQWVGGLGVRRNDTMLRNGIVLAHVTRVLESCDAADPAHFAGLIDRQSRLWWFDLDNSDWGHWQLTSYDASYNQRDEIVQALEPYRRGEGPFPTVPFWHRECPTCPYAPRCERELESRDDVSLVRFTSGAQQILLREHGVATRRELAALDANLAAVARNKALTLHPSHEREVHLGRAIDKLDDLIFRARSVRRGSPLRKVPPAEIGCPTADVEVDVDMESYDDVTYLWGAYVTTRRPLEGVADGYVSFVNWNELSPGVETGVFAEFWQWFEDVRSRARAAHATFAAYCFWAQAENGAMNRAITIDLPGLPSREDLDLFRTALPTEWVDLHEVVKRQIQTDGPLGLKSLARAAGFEWRDVSPSGEASMTWYEEATRADGAATVSRQRLLEYNEDDCRATKVLREWLNGAARDLPSRDEPY